MGRLGRPFFEQFQKAAPGRLVHWLIAVLRSIAAGSIEKNRLIGEEPVAVARSANSPHGIVAESFRKRELEPGIAQKGSLARTGPAYDDIPRKFIEKGGIATAPFCLSF